ncbi:MAG: septum formation initiator family protein [Chthoniobacterales bacterium]|nr:septum formation initiator family protein [Chthoniobacterales bacterium]
MDATGYGHFRERRDATIWQQMNAVLKVLLLIAVWLLMISFFLPPYKQLQRDRAAFEQLNTQLTEQKVILARLTRQVTLLKNDPTYLETIARDNLEMMKEGETIFRLEPRRTERSVTPQP